MSFDRDAFEVAKRTDAQRQYEDPHMRKVALDFVIESDKFNYAYQWSWLGMPMIQMPADILTVQEIIWENKPDVVIETGVAWGGSVVYYASILEMIGNGRMIGVDRVLPEKNRVQMMKYPFSKRISLIEGSSTDPDVINQVRGHIKPGDKVMILLDSNHEHVHVLEELRLYAPLVTQGQFLIVCDTINEDIPKQEHRPRKVQPGNNPKTALREYLTETDRFIEDPYYNAKVLATFFPNGYMRCVK